MGGEGEDDEEGLEGEVLVVRAGEEEVVVAGGDGAGCEGYQGGVGEVGGGEDGEGVGRVFLDAGYWVVVRGLFGGGLCVQRAVLLQSDIRMKET